MSSFKSGFFWGLGFILAIIIVSSTHIVFLDKQLADWSNDLYKTANVESYRKYQGYFRVEVNGIYSDESTLIITAVIKNTYERDLFDGAVIFDIYNRDGVFISACKTRINEMGIAAGESLNIEAKCSTSLEQASQAFSAKGRVVIS